MTDDFEERLKQFRKDLDYICRQHHIVLDAGHIEYFDGTTNDYIICRDGKHRSDWKKFKEEV